MMMMKYSWSTWLCSSDEDDDDDRTAQAIQIRRSNVARSLFTFVRPGEVADATIPYKPLVIQQWSRRYFRSTDYLHMRNIQHVLGCTLGSILPLIVVN